MLNLLSGMLKGKLKNFQNTNKLFWIHLVADLLQEQSTHY
jgi:hypothetical protein